MKYCRATLVEIETLTRLRLEMLAEDGPLPPSKADAIRANTLRFLERGLLDDSLVVWCAELEGSIVAMGAINFFPLPPNDWCPGGLTGYLASLYTLPSCRKQGIAREILRRLQQDAQDRGCERVLLHATNLGKPLYVSMGFAMSESTMAWYPRLAMR